jgi:hypothetical protein
MVYRAAPRLLRPTLEDDTAMSAQSTSIAKTLRANARAVLRARLRHGVGGRPHRGAISHGFMPAIAASLRGRDSHANPGRRSAGAEGMMA